MLVSHATQTKLHAGVTMSMYQYQEHLRTRMRHATRPYAASKLTRIGAGRPKSNRDPYAVQLSTVCDTQVDQTVTK